MTAPTPPPPPPTTPPPVATPSAVPPPTNFYQGPNWHGSWAEVANGTYGGPNKQAPRKDHPSWE